MRGHGRVVVIDRRDIGVSPKSCSFPVLRVFFGNTTPNSLGSAPPASPAAAPASDRLRRRCDGRGLWRRLRCRRSGRDNDPAASGYAPCTTGRPQNKWKTKRENEWQTGGGGGGGGKIKSEKRGRHRMSVLGCSHVNSGRPKCP